MTDKEKELSTVQKMTKIISEAKALSVGIVLLPLFGANIVGLINWSNTMYNINDTLSLYATKVESRSIAFDALVYIDSAIRNEITALDFAIETQISIRNPNAVGVELDDEQAILDDLRNQQKQKILEQQRIRLRILAINPDWIPPEEIE